MAIGRKRSSTKKATAKHGSTKSQAVVISNSQQINYMYNLESKNTSSFVRLAKRIFRNSTTGQFMGLLPKASAKKTTIGGAKRFASIDKAPSFGKRPSSFAKTAVAKKKVGGVKKASVKKASAKKAAPKKAAKKS